MSTPARLCPRHGFAGELCPECILQPGDILLYRGKGFWSWAIRVKTWSHFSHCEIYEGMCGEPASYGRTVMVPKTLASRDGQGVNRYTYTDTNLWAVLRPVTPFDMAAGVEWFEREAKGQPYDWIGLFAFFSARFQGCKNPAMFCSEFIARFSKKARARLFAGDSDAVSPGNLWTNALLRTVFAHADLPLRDVDW